MFLFERLFGIACYLLVLLFVFVAIYNKKLRVKDALIFYVFMLAVFAYFFEPYKTADLYRINAYMEILSLYDLKSFARAYLPGKSTPVAYCLYWLVAQTGNEKLLPAITAILTYSVIFYILYKSSRIYSINNAGTATILLFVMSTGNYMMVISNIRTMLAISLLCLCFFRESVLKKFRFWHILIYIAAALTHNLAMVLIPVRCMALVISSSVNRKRKLLMLMLFAAVCVASLVRFRWLVDAVLEKALGYISGDSYSYFWEYFIAFLALTVEVGTLLGYRKTSDSELRENKTYLLMCIGIACVFVMQFSIFHRLITYIAPILAIPMLAVCFSVLRVRDKLRNRVLFLSVFMLFIACARGELCSLKFFALG